MLKLMDKKIFTILHSIFLSLDLWIKKQQAVTEINIFITEMQIIIEPVHEISNNVVSATSKASDQPANMPSLIRAFASHLSIL